MRKLIFLLVLFLSPNLSMGNIFQSCLGGSTLASQTKNVVTSGETLKSLRPSAGDHYKKRGELLAASQAAWKAGDKEKAHDLSVKGKAEGDKGKELDGKAGEAGMSDGDDSILHHLHL